MQACGCSAYLNFFFIPNIEHFILPLRCAVQHSQHSAYFEAGRTGLVERHPYKYPQFRSRSIVIKGMFTVKNRNHLLVIVLALVGSISSPAVFAARDTATLITQKKENQK